jgi:hypothetical protein
LRVQAANRKLRAGFKSKICYRRSQIALLSPERAIRSPKGGIDRQRARGAFSLISLATSCHLEERMSEPQQEKRAARRFALRVPVTVDQENNDRGEAAQLRDVSARGISFFVENAVAEGSPIGFTLTLPPEITLTESIRVQCKGHVVRVENGRDDGKLTVAAVIEEYEFLPEA